MGFRLLPFERKFFTSLALMADEIELAGRLLVSMVEPSRADLSQIAVIKDHEHRCDKITHDIVQELNRTFVTPIDREDIHDLASRLDDVMDSIDAAAVLFDVYRLSDVRSECREFAALILQQAEQLKAATRLLERTSELPAYVHQLHRLEHLADEVHRRAVGRLFDEETDALLIMKWKQVFDLLEAAANAAEEAANVVEGIQVKHG